MAGRNAGAGAGGMLADFVRSTPPITLGFAAGVLACSLAVHLEIVALYDTALLWDQVFQWHQIWRLVTCNLFVPFGFGLVIQLYVLLQYGSALEGEVFRRGPADYLWMLIVGASFLAAVPSALRMPLYWTADSLMMMMLYVWSKHYPDSQVLINGLITIPSHWTPWALMGLTMMMGGSPKQDLFGILAGHVWWFFTNIYPRTTGRRLVRTPEWLKALVFHAGIGPPPMPPQPPPPGPTSGASGNDEYEDDYDGAPSDNDSGDGGGGEGPAGPGPRRRRGWQGGGR